MLQDIKNEIIGVLGAGTMGSGIAHVAASAGHQVYLFDTNTAILEKASVDIGKQLNRLVEKGKLTADLANEISNRILYGKSLQDFSNCALVIEAIIENLGIKQKVFAELETIVSTDCILASNTSSLSITSIAGACKKPSRVMGIHFFNPAPLMPLVEIIPGVATAEDTLSSSKALIASWGKIVVRAKDTPGFIVNRLARSYYGEAIRIHEENWLGIPTATEGYSYIDAVMRLHGFKMGPFELMDLIGNDINFTVTETVWTQMFYDARYRPSLTQKRLVEAGRFGMKTGQGYYTYVDGKRTLTSEVNLDSEKADRIFLRIISMLINEAIDALYLNIAGRDDLDTAMTKGVNYPKGLLHWCDEIGVEKIVAEIERLRSDYADERYRPSILLKKMVIDNIKFYS